MRRHFNGKMRTEAIPSPLEILIPQKCCAVSHGALVEPIAWTDFDLIGWVGGGQTIFWQMNSCDKEQNLGVFNIFRYFSYILAITEIGEEYLKGKNKNIWKTKF